MTNSVSEFVRKVREKHNKGFIGGSLYELLVRSYLSPLTRQTVSPFFKTKTPQKNWAFLVGCFNSGTTILREVLNTHPEISTLPREGIRFTSIFPDLHVNGWRRMILPNLASADMDLANARSLGQKAINDWSPWWKEGPVFLEKSITHSIRMDFLEQAFESPKFITTVRNGYCVAEGIRRRASPEGKAREEIGDQYPMGLLAQQWSYINRRIRESSKNVKFVNHTSFENFVEYPVETLNSIFDFLEVKAIPLEFDGENLVLPTRTIKLKKTNPASIARLSDADIQAFNREGREELLHNGYAVIEN